ISYIFDEHVFMSITNCKKKCKFYSEVYILFFDISGIIFNFNCILRVEAPMGKQACSGGGAVFVNEVRQFSKTVPPRGNNGS
ncbi:hypothetical protein JW877_04425, partial [bacterium]|nr:hypothetical protein [bacterium]